MASNRLNAYEAAIEIVELNAELFVATVEFEEGNHRAYLEHLRKAQTHLTILILDEDHADIDLSGAE